MLYLNIGQTGQSWLVLNLPTPKAQKNELTLMLVDYTLCLKKKHVTTFFAIT